MKLSPLQLLEYFVAEFHFGLNSRFDAQKPMEMKSAELEATAECLKKEGEGRQWTVMLDLKYQPAVETNTPYLFSMKLVGMFQVAESFDARRVEQLVRTNGASLLYGIGRELVREQTARGPDGPFILPTASFVPDPPPKQVADASSTATTAPVAPAEKAQA